MFGVRQVHFIQHDEVWEREVAGLLRPVECLKEFGLVKALFKGVVVTEQIVSVAPTGLHFDKRGGGADGPGEGGEEGSSFRYR